MSDFALSNFLKLPACAGWLFGMAIGATAQPTVETADIIQSIIGRTMQNDHVSEAVIYADGTLEGVFNGIAFAGTWTLDRGQYCREFTRGLSDAPACMSVEAIRNDDGTITEIVFHGTGGRSEFTLK